MKYLARITVIVILMAALSVTFVYAQDDVETTEMVGSLAQTAGSGMLADNGDGTFTLTLGDVSPFMTWVMHAPAFNAGLKETLSFTEEWSYVPEMVGSGIVVLPNYRLFVSVTSPDLSDDGLTLTYTITDVQQVQVLEIHQNEPSVWVTLDSAKDIEDTLAAVIGLPDVERENVSLFINLDADFIDQWNAGIQARLEGTRAANNACSPQPC